MSTGPEIKIHRHIAIRYGYSIQDDMYHAHFDLPEKDNASHSSQSAIKENAGPILRPGHYHHWNSSEEAVLAGACSDIDLYFDE